MGPFTKLAALVCAALAPVAAAAQALLIAGGVYDDRAALALRMNFVPVAGATVRLYRDGGDRLPSGDDAAIAMAKTNDAGVYTFSVDRAGDYWVTVDSRTIGPEGAWPEQTFGPAGSLCAQPDGGTRTTYLEGSCFGGRTAAGSDDASALATSEHLALVALRENAARVDFAFSFDAVTSIDDGPAIQGSLRQFFENANAVAGPNRMRFVPLTRAPQQRDTSFGAPPRWWIIMLASPLPELRDENTIIDGTAYNFLSAASAVNVHPGRLGEPPTIRPDERTIPRIEKPELELVVNGAEGIVCGSRCGIGAIAIHGAPTAVVTRADAQMAHVLIGASPDGLAAAEPGSVGLEAERGAVTARHVLVMGQSRAGIVVGPDARLDAERLEISRCGSPQTGGGIVLLSDGSAIRSSVIASNPGAGIIVGSLDAAAPANSNTVDGNAISANQTGVLLGPGSSRNVITRNDLIWNRLGGVTVAPFSTQPPRENRLSANRYDENGLRPIVLDLGAEDPNELARRTAECERDPTAANGGISPPRVTSVRVALDGNAARAVIRGRACPGEIVELYQSYATSDVREREPDLPRIRGERAPSETLATQQRENRLPSIGEFNYLGATNTAPDGTFEAAFTLPLATSLDLPRRDGEETNIWFRDVLPGADPTDRAFSAIAIDAAGNTSEMSVRRRSEQTPPR